jgi:hypothetical protein
MRIEAYARVSHPPIDEMSGIVRSLRYPGIYWVHNDSGGEPRIFAIHADGSLVMPSRMGDRFFADKPVKGKAPYPGVRIGVAANSDWEDIALQGDTLYIADTGNNGNARRDLGIYVLPEPNPESVSQARALKWLPVVYPDQKAFPPREWNFDCEAVFLFRNRVHLLTKHRVGPGHDFPGTSTNLYRLDTAYTDRPNVLTLLDSRSDLGGWVTAADLSPDGKTLAVLCQALEQSVWLFPAPADGEHFLSGPARRLRFIGGRQCEGICFESDSTLLVNNEQRDLFRLKIRDFGEVKPGR